ncbi:hypothetical protein [Paraburkholderia ginsengisoli]|uniref:Uncharacterized protein n=1 Tax=Paraburkholderia ginsengisoli TaxID=311231 RepID=A0A7T4T9L0_9BURK|nr:hypothetical protein [Paraburkholderia ginsengisoli]QQC64490.1 hypothetical protein I6I06_03130 [Paraburkholderia ginsengisoli]
MEFIIDASCSDEALNRILSAAEACNTNLRAEIARNDQLIAQAKYRLISRQMEDCPE